MSESRYLEFITFLFERDNDKGEWRFDPCLFDPEFSPEEVLSFSARAFEHYEEDLSGYSDWQLGLGFDYIFNNSMSDWAFYFRDGPIEINVRLNAILALKALFSNCLNLRCENVLSHLSEGGSEINRFCYMLWDVSPLSYCENNPDSEVIYSAVCDVMEHSLNMSNIACIESGLHGLGHLEMYYPRASSIVSRFIKSGLIKNTKLRKYAKSAESGCVQ